MNFQRTIWSALQHIYGGTVPKATVARRRAANRVARVSHRINRKRR